MNNACLHSNLYAVRPAEQNSTRRLVRGQCPPRLLAQRTEHQQPERCCAYASQGASFGTALALVLTLQSSVPLAVHAKENPLQTASQAAMESIEQTKQKTRSAVQQAEDEFEKSDFLKGLREKSTANATKYKKDRESKYCYRQAELGVGDCAGLRLIPGATKSGKQKTPEWLSKILGSPKENTGPVELPDYLKD